MTVGVPENSLAAFGRAIAHGYAIELDVHLLADGAVAVFHDATLLRLCGQAVPLASLGAATLARYRLLGTAEGIPLLAEVLALVAGQVPLLIELKVPGRPAALARAVADALADYAGPVALQSFNPLVVRWLARHAPQQLRGQLVGSPHGQGWTRLYTSWLGRVLLAGLGRPDFLGYEGLGLPNARVARQRAAGRPVLAWTVRSAAEAARLQPALCDNLIFEDFRPAGIPQ